MLSRKQAYAALKNQLLTLYPESEATAVAGSLFQDRYGLSPRDLLLNPDAPFGQQDLLASDVQRLLNHEPLQHITGFAGFYGLTIKTGPEVLIPRPETEELLRLMLERERDALYVADICSGSGCIALGVRKAMPDTRIVALDISAKALDLAKASELLNFGSAGIQWIQADILQMNWEGPLPDVVLSNPPYILQAERTTMDANVLRYEPEIALFAPGSDPLLFYRSIIALFGQGSRIYFELNPQTAPELKTYCASLNLNCTLLTDMFGKTRFALIERKKA